MKKSFLFLFIIGIVFTGCKTQTYLGGYGQINQTQVVLSEANFNVLGSFVGYAIEKKVGVSIKKDIGIIAQAKRDLLNNAEKAGVKMSGSRALVNISVDFIDNNSHVSATVTADIIEFIKD